MRTGCGRRPRRPGLGAWDAVATDRKERRVKAMKNHAVSSCHALTIAEVARLTRVDPGKGLSANAAARRYAELGPNAISCRVGHPLLKSVGCQFRQPLIVILLVAAAVTALLGRSVDAAVILAVVGVNAAVGALQERKAGRTITALARLLRTEVSVRREGRRQRIDAEWLVPGDIVFLQAGDRVPADLRLISGRSLRVDESALTGESRPVPKSFETLAPLTTLAERVNLAFAGTSVVAGQAEGIVWATGHRTEAGRIAQLIETLKPADTPLTRKLAEFSQLLLGVVASLAGLVVVVGWLREETWIDTLMSAVAIAVAAVPEGLPAVITILLAIGATRMAGRRAIIRTLPAVETLGSTTVICTDKTGTLTENAMTVRAIFAGGQMFEVTGQGYEPRGEIRLAGEPTIPARHAALVECLRAGLLCNESHLGRVAGQWTCEGDPTEVAIIVAARKAGMSATSERDGHRRFDVLPFSSERQFMATLHETGDNGRSIIYKKGSAERLLARCATALGDSGIVERFDAEAAFAAVEQMTAEGLRVLAFARIEPPTRAERLEEHHVSGGLTFLGLQGMWDPPRPEAIIAVRHCRRAGISVKMVTGDHVGTAREIARRMRLAEEPIRVLSGREMESLSGDELARVATHTTVFARVTPEQKLHLVRALQAQGHVVAMTGDGVNDAPALRQADIGVAMGKGGSEVAKRASDMVLTDDNFASIEAAVEEGRAVFDNLTKFIVWTIPTNVGEALVLLAAGLVGTALPMLPTQLLWINLATASLLGITLAFEVREHDVMHRPPRRTTQSILTRELLMRTGLVSLLMMLGTFGVFLWELRRGVSPEAARTAVVNVIVGVDCFYLVNCRSLVKPARSLGVFSNPWLVAGLVAMVAAQLAFTYQPVMNAAFHSAPIDPWAWAAVMAVGFFVFLVIGVEKRLRVARRARGSTRVEP